MGGLPVNSWRARTLWLILLATSLGVLIWTLGLVVVGPIAPAQAAIGVPPASDMVMLLGSNPIVIEPIPVRVDVACGPADLERFAGWIAQPVAGEAEPGARARTLHAARLPSWPADVPDWLVHDEIGRVASVKLANQAFWHTWRGLEMAEKAEGKRSEHRDQTLVALAEAGVPLYTAIEAEDRTFHVRDLLRTSLDEFHLGQEEISWTASAYLLYLPPQTTWQNRYGERFSFDDLVEEIMKRPLTRESCGGIHMVMTLTKFARVDKDFGILDPGTRVRLASYLRDKVSDAAASQLDDGSWPLCWSPTGFVWTTGEFTPESAELGRVTITGHLLEWFHFLPSDLKPPVRSVKAGTLWLWSHVRSATKDKVSQQCCPYTHAVVSLDLAASVPTQ